MAVAKKLLTAEEFWEMPGHEDAELIDGEVIPVMPTSFDYGGIAANLITYLKQWIWSGPGGYVGTESGVIVDRNPDRVRGPDVLYVTAEKVATLTTMKGFKQIQPELVAEIISPNESALDVRHKLHDYLKIGTRLVLLIYPDIREVEVHSQGGVARSYGEDDTFEAPDVLPGFSLKVADLFEQ
jgi:Uma2 family endonuclease